jgi:phosphate transport system protein
MKDAYTVSASPHLLFLAKAIERVGNHAKNMAECATDVLTGTDGCHPSPQATGVNP